MTARLTLNLNAGFAYDIHEVHREGEESSGAFVLHPEVGFLAEVGKERGSSYYSGECKIDKEPCQDNGNLAYFRLEAAVISAFGGKEGNQTVSGTKVALQAGAGFEIHRLWRPTEHERSRDEGADWRGIFQLTGGVALVPLGDDGQKVGGYVNSALYVGGTALSFALPRLTVLFFEDEIALVVDVGPRIDF